MNMDVKEIMDHTAAMTIYKTAKFEEWLQKETHEERKAREERAKQMLEDHEKRNIEIKQKFTEVIEGAGFTEAEREVIAQHEEKLPMAHIKGAQADL